MEGIPQSPSFELPQVNLEITSSFDSKLSPIYYNKILNSAGEEIGKVDYQLQHKDKKIIIQSIEIKDQGKGYGKAVYKSVQDRYPDYRLVSSDQMTHKTNSEQELPDAVRLWESLVKSGLAEKTEDGYQMKG